MRMTTRNETAADHDEAEGRSAEALRPGLRERFRPYLAGAAVLLVGCAVTLFVFLDVRRQHLQQLDDEFQDEASEIYQLLQRTIDWHVDVLNGLSGLFNASVLVTEAEFETFVAPALERQPHIYMLGWAPRLPADELPSRINLLRGRGIGDVIDPESGAPYQTVPERDLFPIVFGRPVPEQGLTRGFDLAGDVILRTAMAWARDSGLPTASRPLDLVGGDGAGRGIVIFCPLFARDSDPVDYVERREALTVGNVDVTRQHGLGHRGASGEVDPIHVDTHCVSVGARSLGVQVRRGPFQEECDVHFLRGAVRSKRHCARGCECSSFDH